MAEFNLGTLSTTPKLTKNFVGDNDISDVFSFSLGAPSNLNLALTHLIQDADVRVFIDVDNDGKLTLEIDTEIGSSIRSSNSDDSIDLGSLSAGNYYLAQVAITNAIAPLEIQEVPMQRLFEVWQDLAYESTGCDTEWGHPIPLNDIVQALGITNHILLQQLAQQEILELELISAVSSDPALTFHNPV